jgi:hypothetical protein
LRSQGVAQQLDAANFLQSWLIMALGGKRRMRLTNVSFKTWLRSHGEKEHKERWLRELYPWPVFAQIDCDQDKIGVVQEIKYNNQLFFAIIESIHWQESHRTFRYKVHIQSEGLGWHGRTLDDKYDLCGAQNGAFVTLFHAKSEEPLERIARAFFSKRWGDISKYQYKSLSVSSSLSDLP